MYGKYLEHLLFFLHSRFLPWPSWVIESDFTFNFVKDITDNMRMDNFKRLMDHEHGPVPLRNEERNRLEAEFQTLLVVVALLKSTTDFKTAKDIWIKLLVTEEHYSRLKFLNKFALRFLTRTLNECTVEAQVSTIREIESSKRHLKSTTGERLTFIVTNDPHPWQSLKVVKNALNMYFDNKPRHFVMTTSKYYVSNVVDRQMLESRDFTNVLA